MNRKSLLLAAFWLLGAVWGCRADPMSFQEVSLMVRTGESPRTILNEVAKRKLLMGLTPDQEAKLQQNGAPTPLIAALRSASFLASPQELEAYVARRQTQAQAALAAQQRAPTPTAPVPLPPQAVVMSDHFTDGIEAAKTAHARTMSEQDAFSPAQLDEARTKARSERKPIGFIIESKKCFGQAYNTRQTGGYAALFHFYEAFKDSLILVFVPSDVQVALPEAVARGIKASAGANAPYMVVVDAGATEFVCAFTSGDLKADGLKRDEIFKTGAAKMQEWLGYHPSAYSSIPRAPR